MKKVLQTILGLVLFVTITNTKVLAQGCVAIRSTGGICAMAQHPDSTTETKGGYWLYNNNNRYYRSFRHFVGKVEQTQRIAMHNNVINHTFTQDNTFTRIFNDRWSVSLNLPFAANTRSQVSSGVRFATSSFGIGDVSATGFYWLFNPKKATKGNVQLGMGFKFATGTYNYQDYFLNGATGTHTLAPVDQSIQLGDGGTGIILDVNSYYNPTHNFGFYGNFYYMANPRDVNGVPSSSSTPSALKVAITSDVLSVPDQYMARVGAALGVNRFNFSLGLRDDCVPVRDLIGTSDGFRRPGWVLSLEPGVTYAYKNIAIYAYVPIALMRDRTQSVPDMRQTDLTGVYAHGDAAFADYVVNVGITVKF